MSVSPLFLCIYLALSPVCLSHTPPPHPLLPTHTPSLYLVSEYMGCRKVIFNLPASHVLRNQTHRLLFVLSPQSTHPMLLSSNPLSHCLPSTHPPTPDFSHLWPPKPGNTWREVTDVQILCEHPQLYFNRSLGDISRDLFCGCLTSQQHAGVSQGQIYWGSFTWCYIEIEIAKIETAGQTCFSPSHSIMAVREWSHVEWSCHKLHMYFALYHRLFFCIDWLDQVVYAAARCVSSVRMRVCPFCVVCACMCISRARTCVRTCVCVCVCVCVLSGKGCGNGQYCFHYVTALHTGLCYCANGKQSNDKF